MTVTITQQQITDEIIGFAVDALNTSALSKIAKNVIVRMFAELDDRGRITLLATYCDLIAGERSYELILRASDITPTAPEHQPVAAGPVVVPSGVGELDEPPGDAA